MQLYFKVWGKLLISFVVSCDFLYALDLIIDFLHNCFWHLWDRLNTGRFQWLIMCSRFCCLVQLQCDCMYVSFSEGYNAYIMQFDPSAMGTTVNMLRLHVFGVLYFLGCVLASRDSSSHFFQPISTKAKHRIVCLQLHDYRHKKLRLVTHVTCWVSKTSVRYNVSWNSEKMFKNLGS